MTSKLFWKNCYKTIWSRVLRPFLHKGLWKVCFTQENRCKAASFRTFLVSTNQNSELFFLLVGGKRATYRDVFGKLMLQNDLESISYSHLYIKEFGRFALHNRITGKWLHFMFFSINHACTNHILSRRLQKVQSYIYLIQEPWFFKGRLRGIKCGQPESIVEYCAKRKAELRR